VSHATTDRPLAAYPPSLIALHWATVLILAVLFTAIEVRGYFPKGSATRDLLIATHKSLGVLVFILVIIRATIRARATRPAIWPQPPAWQNAIATLTHATLYAAMIAMPVLGVMMTSAAGRATPFFGLHIPPLIAENKDLAHQLVDIHEFIGNALYYIIALHAGAALFHHYAMRDNTLVRMLRPQR
jgi:superoxide oxidase